MTKGDRSNLTMLARKRARVATSMIGERVKVLRADVEDHLSAEHSFDDDLWSAINREAKRVVERADQQIAAECARLGIPEHLRPSLGLSWRGRGENALAERRAELRKLAHARIDAAAESAKVTIAAGLLDVETELVRDGLESDDALRFVESMPTVEQLLPPVDVAALTPGERSRGRYESWKPPAGTTAQLLSPTTATGREEKRRAVAAALASSPDGSNREIARRAGVDHRTVSKLRGEMLGIQVGSSPPESPADSPLEVVS